MSIREYLKDSIQNADRVYSQRAEFRKAILKGAVAPETTIEATRETETFITKSEPSTLQSATVLIV